MLGCSNRGKGMSLYLLKEVRLFSLSILYGMGILLFYDCFRVIRRWIPHNEMAIAIQDLLFWIVTGCSIFSLLYHYNNGSIRAYCIVGMGIGMIFYSMTISPFFIKLAVNVFVVVKQQVKKGKKSKLIQTIKRFLYRK